LKFSVLFCKQSRNLRITHQSIKRSDTSTGAAKGKNRIFFAPHSAWLLNYTDRFGNHSKFEKKNIYIYMYIKNFSMPFGNPKSTWVSARIWCVGPLNMSAPSYAAIKIECKTTKNSIFSIKWNSIWQTTQTNRIWIGSIYGIVYMDRRFHCGPNLWIVRARESFHIFRFRLKGLLLMTALYMESLIRWTLCVMCVRVSQLSHVSHVSVCHKTCSYHKSYMPLDNVFEYEIFCIATSDLACISWWLPFPFFPISPARHLNGSVFFF